MKGSGVLLLGCFALLCTTPSHAYSVKFISEDDQLANPQGSESGSPSSPDVATPEDAVQSVNNDTAPDENGSVIENDNTKPADELVPESTQTGESKIRKRDTLGLVKNLMVDMQEDGPNVDKIRALKWLRLVGDEGFKCYNDILRYLEKYEMGPDPDAPEDYPKGFTKYGMIRWLKIIQGLMSQCFNEMSPPLRDVLDPVESDDTPITVKPNLELDLISEEELVMWLQTIGISLDRSFAEANRFLEEKEVIWKKLTDPSKRSPGAGNDLFAKFVEIISNVNGMMPDIGDQMQDGPPDHTVPPYPDGVPLAVPYKKGNYFVKSRTVHYPVIGDITGITVPEDPPPVAFPIPGSMPEVIQEPPPPIPFPIPGSMPEVIQEPPPPITFPVPGSMPEVIQEPPPPVPFPVPVSMPEVIHHENPTLIPNIISKPYPHIITTLPSQMYNTRKSSPYFSLLDLVLNQIYKRLPSVGMSMVPAEQGLRDDVRGIISLLGTPNNRPNSLVGNSDLGKNDINMCVDTCMRGASKTRAARKMGQQ